MGKGKGDDAVPSLHYQDFLRTVHSATQLPIAAAVY
jgi:hypothetical protein